MIGAMPLRKIDPFDRFVLSVLLILAAAIGLVIALGDRVGVQIVQVSPVDVQDFGARSSITLTFAEPMIAESVESRFTIEPVVAGDWVWSERRVTFRPTAPLMPGELLTLRLAAGAESRTGRRLLADQAWTFQVRAPQIVYLAAGQANPRELWRIDPATLERIQLTHTDGRIFDFAVAPDGESIVFSLINAEFGTDFWLVGRDGVDTQLLLDCGPDLCSGAAWSADGQRIAYSREPAGLAPGAPKGPPRVWTLSVSDSQTAPLYQDGQIIGYSPAWSPDGSMLGMVDNSTSSIRVLQLKDQTELLLETHQGTMGSFSPDGSRLIYTTLRFDDATAPQPFTMVMVADLDRTGSLLPILGREYNVADYGTPAWSPTGEWIAINQRTENSGPSKQVWIVRPDGSEATALTADADYTYAGYRWSPWGDALVMQRFPLGKPYATPEVVLWTMAAGAEQVLAVDASLPEWLP